MQDTGSVVRCGGVKERLKANQDEVGLLMTCMRGLIRFKATTRLLTNTSFLW